MKAILIILFAAALCVWCTNTGNRKWLSDSERRYYRQSTLISQYGNFTEYLITSSPASGYPNPFSPLNVFKYERKETCEVNLTVFDISANQVDSAYFGKNSPGYYEAIWNPQEIPSGTYFIIYSICDFTDTTNIVLIK